jgi:N-acetylglucosaminyl-diphospho-decaprenol L-rhamnosyltransferase
MNHVDVAVVIVTYKSAGLAIDCLASIESERRLSQNLNIQVVVVDNASGDLPQIRQAIDRNAWSWVTPLLAPINGGFAYGNNLGIRNACETGRPNYVYLLNPDTQVRRGAIATLVEFLESHPQVGIAGSSFETESGADWPFAFRFPTMLSEIEDGVELGLVSRCLSRWSVARSMNPIAQPSDWISGASMMIRPAVFAAIGCLDENFFLYFEETEFCHRARQAGFATWYVPKSRVMHLIGKSTSVNENTRFRQRLPGYWFDSRMRYYAITRGLGNAALIDAVTIAASLVGLLKRKLLGRPSTPHYIRDLLSHSALLRKNRHLAPLKSYRPPTSFAGT